MTNTLIIPTVHMNGTGKQTLIEEYVNAMNAVQTAIDALAQITVHSRDYYPQGNDAINEAKYQWNKQYDELMTVRNELEAIAIAIDEQGN
jgi:predicted ATPase